MHTRIAVGLVLMALAGSAAYADGPAELEPLAFLIGEWPASGAGQPGVGSGTAAFTRELQERVIVRTSFAEYPATAGKPKSRHDDLMVIYASGGTVRADYFDNEGHVIHYVVRSPAPGEAVFVSEPGVGEPTFRLTYQLAADGLLRGEFAIAPPGAAGTFKPYLTWESRQTRSPRK